MRPKLLAALCAAALTSVLLGSPPAAADKPSEPDESGVVERPDASGGHAVGPVTTDVGGVTLPILVVVGFDDAETYCTGGPPVFDGVQQNVIPPSGSATIVVHNSEIPILVFDTSAAVDEQDFFERCAAGEIVPLATGTAKQRPILHVTDSVFSIKVKTRGVVTDAGGQDWTMQSFLKLREVAGEDEPKEFKEWVTLTAR